MLFVAYMQVSASIYRNTAKLQAAKYQPDLIFKLMQKLMQPSNISYYFTCHTALTLNQIDFTSANCQICQTFPFLVFPWVLLDRFLVFTTFCALIHLCIRCQMFSFGVMIKQNDYCHDPERICYVCKIILSVLMIVPSRDDLQIILDATHIFLADHYQGR